MKSKLGWLFALGPLAVLTSCADLSEIQKGVCGNGVIDPHEDCDSSDASCGKPGTPAACRFTCATSGTCAEGYTCGGFDHVCRRPAGELSPASSPTSTPSRVADIADFDGDGYGDVLAVTANETVVHYHGERAQHLSSTAIPGSLSLPVAGTLTDTPEGARSRASFMVARDAVFVVVGEAGRVLTPKSFAPFSVPDEYKRFLFMDLLPNVPGREIVVLAAGANGIALVFPQFDSLPPLIVPGIDATLLPANPLVADFDAQTPCDELLIANEGAKSLDLIRTKCDLTYSASVDKIDLPAQAEVVGEAHVGYLNADDKLDLYLTVALPQAGKQEHVVGYGVGNGRFNSDPSIPDPPPTGFGDNKLVAFAPAALEFNKHLLLAAGDLNGDGMPDFVLPDTVVMSWSVAGLDRFLPLLGTRPRGLFRGPAARLLLHADAAAQLGGGSHRILHRRPSPRHRGARHGQPVPAAGRSRRRSIQHLRRGCDGPGA